MTVWTVWKEKKYLFSMSVTLLVKFFYASCHQAKKKIQSHCAGIASTLSEVECRMLSP